MRKIILLILLPLFVCAGTPQRKETIAKVTAYCPCSKCCGRRAKGVTASGGTAWKKGIAADERFAKFGTLIHVPDYGVAEVDDTGSAMRRSYNDGIIHLDIRFGTHEKAKNWGIRWLKIVRVEN